MGRPEIALDVCYNVLMMRVNIAEAKASFSRLLRTVRLGEVVTICDRNVPIAELRAVVRRSGGRRKIGPAVPGYEIRNSFFEPLPDALLRAFEGRGD